MGIPINEIITKHQHNQDLILHKFRKYLEIKADCDYYLWPRTSLGNISSASPPSGHNAIVYIKNEEDKNYLVFFAKNSQWVMDTTNENLVTISQNNLVLPEIEPDLNIPITQDINNYIHNFEQLQKASAKLGIKTKELPGQYNVNDIFTIYKLLEKGNCSGFSALWLLRKRYNKETLYHDDIKRILEWDEERLTLETGNENKDKNLTNQIPLHETFEQMISDIIWLQNKHSLLSNLRQKDYDDLLNFIQVDIPIKPEFDLTFVFKKNELAKTLSEIVHEDKMISLFSHNHAIGLIMKKNDKGVNCYYVYDPNTGEHEIPLDSQKLNYTLDPITGKEEIAPHLLKLVEVLYTAYDALETPDKQNEVENIALSIHIFSDEATLNKDLYPKKEEIIEKIMQSRIKNGDAAPLDITSWEGNTALHMNALQNDLEGIQILSVLNADLNKCNEKNQSALMSASIIGNSSIVESLVNNNVLLNIRDTKGNTALILATVQGSLDSVNSILKQKNIVNIPNIEGSTPLMVASILGNDEILLALIKAGALIDSTDMNMKTALMLAIENNSNNTAVTLINLHADLNKIDRNQVSTLMYAAQMNNWEIVALLLQQPSLDLNIRGPNRYAIQYINSDSPAEIIELMNKQMEQAELVPNKVLLFSGKHSQLMGNDSSELDDPLDSPSEKPEI